LEECSSTLSIKLDNINSPVNDLSGGQQRSIEVGRAAYWGGKIIIFDEPTNNLGVEQQQKVLSLIKRLRDEFGVSIIVISHDLKVIEKIKAETTENEIVSMITGAAC